MKEIRWKGRVLKFDRPLIMGILNVTPDSFSDGGRFFSRENALKQAEKMAGEGADIIDVGGESTRPYAEQVSAEEEIRRIIPVIRKIKKKLRTLVSIDTYKSEVACRALEEGADIINDISALRMDRNMGKAAARAGVPVILMHMQGRPRGMQASPRYGDVIRDIAGFLGERIKKAKELGIDVKKIIIDPGIGFGKTVEHNLLIIKNLEKFKKLGCPVLAGPSRKSFIGKVLNLKVYERFEGTAAAVAICVWNGADIVRVHDVKEMKRVADLAYAIKTV
ncbi:dihydropteroate synthase [Candidatus Desantisbacteria bacterium CG_4_10_14_0_8_um_filter_48_22]|uniref:Dihydropteroate synthase n=1 Tax=Candidatus Desantisbacteria bacterium CG_4_10_14_0_8_um_filter_48_22 TaxID=1974543 RepID=A0A2M7S9Q3_9BACT|nr:MAG: dihydropteroate synthase [Candidatus Desantisbacteria bacterium CG1_02_49_89]PIZ16023.1 MAG: dihydropteroate synthase [Candidatus Desantisbacteria bacterium CG_4_10_14_0_8_um_filter_48_22]